MTPENEKREIPAHYPTIRGSLRRLGIEYLKSLDAFVRIIGACVIWAILFGGIWCVFWALGGFWSYLQEAFGSSSSDGTTGWVGTVVGLLLGPPIIRLGLLGAGIEIRPLFRKEG